jgi:hypothetical protein
VEPTKPKLASEAIELYNDFIHGEISRRAFMEGVQRLAGGLAAATVINALMPNYARGQQVSRTDDRIKATYETVPSPKGNGSIAGIRGRGMRDCRWNLFSIANPLIEEISTGKSACGKRFPRLAWTLDELVATPKRSTC